MDLDFIPRWVAFFSPTPGAGTPKGRRGGRESSVAVASFGSSCARGGCGTRKAYCCWIPPSHCFTAAPVRVGMCLCGSFATVAPSPPPRCVTTRVVKCEIRTFPKPLDGGSTALARFQSDPGSGCSSCHDAKAVSQFQGNGSQPRGLRAEAPLNICHSFENQFVKAQVW